MYLKRIQTLSCSSRYTGRWWGLGEPEVFAEGSWLDDLALALYIYCHRTLESISMIAPKPAAHGAQVLSLLICQEQAKEAATSTHTSSVTKLPQFILAKQYSLSRLPLLIKLGNLDRYQGSNG